MLVFILSVLVIMLFLTIHFRIKNNIVADFSLYRPINNTHKWVERILLILYVIITFIAFFAFKLSHKEIYALLFGFFTILTSFRAFMEYKHEREEKNYIIQLTWSIGYFIIFIGIIALFL
jgi:uncharacterized membrane protein YfcA